MIFYWEKIKKIRRSAQIHSKCLLLIYVYSIIFVVQWYCRRCNSCVASLLPKQESPLHWKFLLIGRRLFWSEAQRSFLTSLSSAIMPWCLATNIQQEKPYMLSAKAVVFRIPIVLSLQESLKALHVKFLLSHSVLKIQNCKPRKAFGQSLCTQSFPFYFPSSEMVHWHPNYIP